MTTRDLERRLTMREFVEWQTFEEEFGPLTLHQRIDAAAGFISAAIAASVGAERPDPADFMPDWRPEPYGNVVDFFRWTARGVS